ncbi:RNA polymerase sigma24 factor [Paractinoplanes deccanensis]|uniref:RNA polymerase sigma24 factor n=1 Tax=Paractinoplanes deccanensis TaxID=113561 RepID=A0ABQ3YHG1_9ACTN|nr:RNA polymerase sigma factor SigJ [Actinoplanes deccanensis]GID79438.1 RNA polymerase sigma24 factor [Actinoplanes deccanensis]
MSERRQLLNLAYRMTGSLADAEDVVQETYARWYAMTPAQRDAVAAPGAWMTTVASRVCLDLLGSARARRERYVGEWIPEPLPSFAVAAPDPADRVTLDESVTMAFLVVLDAMTPAERVVFVLHDVFGYPFAEVAEIVGRTPVACRKLASSARKRVRLSRPEATPAAEQAGVVRGFRQAWEARDIEALVGLLDPDATIIADGGGLADTAPHPLRGREEIAAYLTMLFHSLTGSQRVVERPVNGRPGLVIEEAGVTVTVMAFEVAAGRVRHVWAVRNPEKLRAWTA